MYKIQELLDFDIETPSDEELRARYIFHSGADCLNFVSGERRFLSPVSHRKLKKRNRKTRYQKKLERLQRESDRVSCILNTVMNTIPDFELIEKEAAATAAFFDQFRE